jgi:hypothetical protein
MSTLLEAPLQMHCGRGFMQAAFPRAPTLLISFGLQHKRLMKIDRQA